MNAPQLQAAFAGFLTPDTEPVAQYPHAPGHRGIDTSIAAADAVASKLGRLQAMAFDAIRTVGARGLTADELCERLDLDRYTIQPRTSELRRMGKIRDSGQRRRNASNKLAIVWVAVDEQG